MKPLKQRLRQVRAIIHKKKWQTPHKSKRLKQMLRILTLLQLLLWEDSLKRTTWMHLRLKERVKEAVSCKLTSIIILIKNLVLKSKKLSRHAQKLKLLKKFHALLKFQSLQEKLRTFLWMDSKKECKNQWLKATRFLIFTFTKSWTLLRCKKWENLWNKATRKWLLWVFWSKHFH